MPPGVKVIKWPHKERPDAANVKREMADYGYRSHDLQTIPPWFERSRHSHDYDEIGVPWRVLQLSTSTTAQSP